MELELASLPEYSTDEDQEKSWKEKQRKEQKTRCLLPYNRLSKGEELWGRRSRRMGLASSLRLWRWTFILSSEAASPVLYELSPLSPLSYFSLSPSEIEEFFLVADFWENSRIWSQPIHVPCILLECIPSHPFASLRNGSPLIIDPVHLGQSIPTLSGRV